MASLRARGMAIALAGVLAVSPDAMLLRWMRALGASGPDVAVAKYLGIIAFMLLLGSYRGLDGARDSPHHFFASAFCQLGYQLSFTFCLLLTEAAKALLLISLAPLWAALLGVVVLREPLPIHTVIALVLSVGAVGLVFAPRVLDAVGKGAPVFLLDSATPSLSLHDYSLVGDVLAVLTGLTQGASLTVNRHAALRRPNADLTLATALSSFCAAIIALYLPCYDTDDAHDFWACSPPVWRTPSFLALALADAVAVACFYVSMLVAPRYISGSEVALVNLLEVVLGPCWVLLRFGDVPSLWTVVGGGVLLATLAVHELFGRRLAAQLSAAGPGLGDRERSYHALGGRTLSGLW